MSVPALSEKYDITETGLRIHDPDLPYEEFADLCYRLGRFHEAVRFAIGDAIIQGEHLYGDDCHQAIEEMNLSEDARQEYVRVAQRVPPSLRRKGLSWSHHRAVAGLTLGKDAGGEPIPDVEAQKMWLERCVNERLSHHDLREEMRNGSEPAVMTHCRCCGRELESALS